MSSGVGHDKLPRRRNGKEQACEPCRRAKIACDHGLPVCHRCIRRKVPSKCVYLPAPMTRPGPDYRTRSEPASSLNHTPTSPPTGSSSFPVATALPYPQDAVTRPTPESSPFIKSGGFFGPTNFSAVFIENKERLGNEDIQISNDSEPFVASFESLQSQTFLMIAGKELRGSPRVCLGTKILRMLPDQQTCKFLLEWYYEKCHCGTFPKAGILSIANSVWTTYPSHMKEPRREDDMEEISRNLCKNSEKALEEVEDYEGWLKSCSGANLRWEALGMAFGALTTAILSLPERDAFFTTQRGDRRNRRNFSVEMKDCVQACITLSNYMDLINYMMVVLLCQNLVLQTVISGDASLVVWRQLGDVVSATTALGLHRQPDNQKISFLSEIKKRLMTCVFNLDKGSSLLTGRPPFLSYRYTRFRLPTDVSDEALMRGGEDLQRAIDNIDPDGWNKEGNIYPNTSTRAYGLCSPVLNEILDMFLGDPEYCTAEKMGDLMQRLQSVCTSYPPFLHFKLSDLSNPDVSDHIFWKRLCLRLMNLEHRLLLERLAHKHGALDGQSMVDCARELLELTVLLWVQRDRFVEYHHDYDWMLMCWGIPSSGVLCVELLKQMKLPPDTPNLLRIPRSEIVQNLSLLIGFLEWVKPAAGNYQLCMRMRIIIKRILDQILNPASAFSGGVPCASQESTAVSTGGSEGTGNVNVGFDPGQPWDAGMYDDGMNNMDWLNSVDWSRGPWLDLGQDFSTARWA